MTVACGYLLSSEEHFTELSTSGGLRKVAFLKMLFHKRLAFFGNSAFFSFYLLPLKIPLATAYNRNFVLDSLVFSCPKFQIKRSVVVNFLL